MPDLPTYTVTSAQASRIIAAFGSQLEYRRWLRATVINIVVSRESEAIRASMEAEMPEPTA